MKRLAVLLGFALFAALVSSAPAEQPAQPQYAPKPPGSIVQGQSVYLAGESMNDRWRAVLSKKLLGTMTGGTAAYQWYLSIYRVDGNVYRLRYQSPRDGGPLTTVAKANGAEMWFPYQQAKIVGTGEFMGAGAQQLVVQSHETGADCGSARVDVFFDDAAMNQVMRTLSVENGCDLSARIVRAKGGDELQLTGPYYAKNAALCCPTKPHATATFRFVNGQGRWTQTPSYFRLAGQREL